MATAPDWALLRSFLAVAETGSLSAAARALGLTQPTLGRHISELEAALAVVLFTRVPRGLALTGAGQDLLPPAQAMRDAAARLALVAAGRSDAMAGPVRITASQVVAGHILPPLLADLRIAEPRIEIELVASDRTDNLLFGEADIALRMYRPTQLDTVARHVCDLAIGLHASRGYLDRRGVPQTLDALRTHDLVGLDRSDIALRLTGDLHFPLRREDFVVRCDDQLAGIALVRAGCGIGAVLRDVAAADPDLVALPDLVPIPPLPVWLVAPTALRQAPRLRRVFDFLADGLKRRPRLDPDQRIG